MNYVVVGAKNLLRKHKGVAREDVFVIFAQCKF